MSFREMTAIEKLRHFGEISGWVRESFWDGLTRAECNATHDHSPLDIRSPFRAPASYNARRSKVTP